MSRRTESKLRNWPFRNGVVHCAGSGLKLRPRGHVVAGQAGNEEPGPQTGHPTLRGQTNGPGERTARKGETISVLMADRRVSNSGRRQELGLVAKPPTAKMGR